LPEGWEAVLPRFTPADAPVATRKLSEGVLTALSSVLPELLGGSADLTGSNLTRWKQAVDFQHVSYIEKKKLNEKTNYRRAFY
jgi:transketolase